MIAIRKCRLCGKEFDAVYSSLDLKCKQCKEDEKFRFSDEEILEHSKTYKGEAKFPICETVSDSVDVPDDLLSDIEKLLQEYESKYPTKQKMLIGKFIGEKF